VKGRTVKRFRVAALCVVTLVIIAGAAVILGGCSGKSAAGPGSAPAASAASPATAPTIEIVAPVADGKVAAGDVSMSVKTTGLKLVMASNTNVPGEGHVHFTLDSEPFKMSVKPDYVYAGVTPGQHTLKAELVQNDTKSFNPPVEQVITFTAE
jgi:hypothetical protein